MILKISGHTQYVHINNYASNEIIVAGCLYQMIEMLFLNFITVLEIL